MAEYATILVEQRGAVTLVTLNRPEALNALSSAVLEDLISAFAAFQADENQRCAVITGSGEKAFAAGADIKEMAVKGAADFYRDDTFALSAAMMKSAIIASSHPPPTARSSASRRSSSAWSPAWAAVSG